MKNTVKNPRSYHGRQRGTIFYILAALLLAVGLYYVLFLSKATLFIGYTLIFVALFPLILGLSYLFHNPLRGILLRRIVCVIALLLVLLAGAVLSLVVRASGGVMRAEPSMVMVLGTQVKQNGPGEMLRARLDTAYDYLEEHPELPVLVCGGQGPDEPTTEAEAMRDYLVERGIDEERIIMEDQSHNTRENVVNAKALLAELGYTLEQEHVLVISNDFHLFRADMLLRRYGFHNSTMPAPSSNSSAKISGFVREIPAVLKSYLLD